MNAKISRSNRIDTYGMTSSSSSLSQSPRDCYITTSSPSSPSSPGGSSSSGSMTPPTTRGGSSISPPGSPSTSASSSSSSVVSSSSSSSDSYHPDNFNPHAMLEALMQQERRQEIIDYTLDDMNSFFHSNIGSISKRIAHCNYKRR